MRKTSLASSRHYHTFRLVCLEVTCGKAGTVSGHDHRSCSLGDYSLNSDFDQELTRVFANRVFVRGETSSELMQSLLITVTYHSSAHSS